MSKTKIKTTNEQSDGFFFQPVAFYNEEYRVGFHKEHLAYPFYCPNVFQTEEEALAYAPIWIKALIHTGDIPQDAMQSSTELNEKKIKTAIQKVMLTAIEKDED